MTTTLLPGHPAQRPGPVQTPLDQRTAFTAGMRAMLPNLAGISPLGLAIGAAAAGSGLSAAGLVAGLLIYSGSAQLAAIDLLGRGASAVLVVGTVLVINARLLLYSSAMAPRWRGTSRRWQLLAAYLLIDPSFVVGAEGYDKRRPASAGHAHYLGAACLLWVTWQLAILAGSTVGSVVPAGLHVDFLVSLYLVALLMPKLTSRPARAGALVGAVAAAAGSLLPVHVGPAAGIVAGLAVALSYKEKSR